MTNHFRMLAKPLTATGILLFALLAACAPKTYLSKVTPDFFRYNTTSQSFICAHRGGGDYKGYPENCIESFDWLAKQMPIIIECDISMTQDSVLMMMHDYTLDRTTTGTGKISEKTWAYCQTLQLEDNFGNLTTYKIPTLAQVLQWGRGKVAYTLDVKKGVPFERVVAQVHAAKAQNYSAIITYNVTDAMKVYALDPNLMISVTIRNRDEYQRYHDAGLPDNRMIAFVGTTEPDAELCKFLHAKGIRCILGTLGNLDKMVATKGDNLYKEFVDKGSDVLSSDRPLEAYKAVSGK